MDSENKTRIMKSYRGSISHNLFVPSTDPNHTDDIDLFEVHLAPKEYYIGFGKDDHKVSLQKIEGVYDTVDYELRHFTRMCLNCNPNAITALFLNKEHYIESTPYWKTLHSIRRAFISKRIYNTFSGYAQQERIRMEKSMSGEKKYLGYMGAKRKELVDKFGYDTKNATNVIRIITMAIETLLTMDIKVHRNDDREELLGIKQGKFPLDYVLTRIKQLEDGLDLALRDSKLPDEPNIDLVNRIVMGIIYEHLSRK